MKKFFTVTVIILLLAAGNHLNAQTTTVASGNTGSKTEQELNKITTEVVNAFMHADKKMLEQYLADNYISTHSNGEVTTKAQSLENLQVQPSGNTWDIEDVRVKDYGNTAVESFKIIFTFEGNNQNVTTMNRYTSIFMKQGGQWKIIALHTSVIPADKTVAKIDPAIYDAYVGEYQLGPNAFLTLTREGDKLMGKATGNKTGFEFLPESETTFFMKNKQGQVTFVKDDKGQVSHILHRYADGQEVKEIKVK